jgi:hypothetical protein
LAQLRKLVFTSCNFQEFAGFFVCLFRKCKQTTYFLTKTCTLVWDTNPKSPPSFSSIELGMTKTFHLKSLTDNNNNNNNNINNNRNNVWMASKTIVDCDFVVAADKNWRDTERAYSWFPSLNCLDTADTRKEEIF